MIAQAAVDPGAWAMKCRDLVRARERKLPAAHSVDTQRMDAAAIA